MSTVAFAALGRARERATRLFFRYFFRMLLVAVAIGEWVCLAHIARAAIGPLAPWTYIAGPIAFYGMNRLIVRVPPTTPVRWKHRALIAYSAFAFATIFGCIFLILDAVLWSLIGFLSQGVSLAAGEHAAAVIAFPSLAYEWTSTAGLLVIGLSFLYGYTFGQARLVVTRLRLPLRRGAESLRGLRIVQISDIHIGRYMDPEVLQGYVEQVNNLEPDIIAITGDIVDSLNPIPEGFPVLARLRARYGVFAILGNHDFYAGADEVADALRKMTSFTVLRDEVATVEVDGAKLQIAGVDDLGRDWARGVDFHPGLARLLPRLAPDAPVILLAHRPDLLPHAAAAGIELVLSGHTHGGQLSLPGFGGRPISLARFITPYDQGLYREGSSFLYVNRGLGCTAQRVRLFTPRDIAVIEVDVAAEGERRAA